MAELFRVQMAGPGYVIELLVPDSIDPVEFDQLNSSMLAHFDGKAAKGWILDLTSVNYIGSAMLGLMVNVRQRVKSAGGKLVLCGMSKQLTEIFHTSSMERLFTIAKTRSEALRVLSE